MKTLSKLSIMIYLVSTSMLLVGCATTDPAKLDLTPGKGKSALLAQTKFSSGIDYILLKKFNGDEDALNNPDGTYRSNLTTSVAALDFKKIKDGYVTTQINPGIYFIESAVIQRNWAGCFSNDTYIFEVKPGEVVFLGELAMALNSLEIQNRIVEEGDDKIRIPASSYGAVVKYYHNLEHKPMIREANPDDISAAKAYLREQNPELDISIRKVNLKPFKYDERTAFDSVTNALLGAISGGGKSSCS